MIADWYPPAVRLPITTKEFFNPRGAVLVAICDHITDGTDSRDWLQHADNQSSVHFLIRMEGAVAVVYQFMPVTWAAWGNGRYSLNNPYMPQWVRNMIARNENINRATISIEHERDWPFTSLPPEAMTRASIDLHQWLCDAYPAIVRDRQHILGHYQIDHISRANCPGGPGGLLFPFDRIVGALNNEPHAQGDPCTLYQETGFPVCHGFRDYYNANGGIPRYGYPITGEMVDEIGSVRYTVQYFQRARFEWHDKGPEPAHVEEGLIGAELLALKGGV